MQPLNDHPLAPSALSPTPRPLPPPPPLRPEPGPIAVDELRTAPERRLGRIARVVSAIAWLALLLSIVGAVYGILIAAVVVVSHALFLAHVRGNGVRLGPQQLPEVWAKVEAASRRLGLPVPPETYVLESGGILNAFATRLLGRRFVILYSQLLEACERESPAGQGPSELDFVIAHEVGHLAAGHLSWFLLPARALPLLGPAYSRACEYTCDRCGHAFVGELRTSQRALAILAAGGHAGRRLDLQTFAAQQAQHGFWMDVYELSSSHPYLAKRVAALRALGATDAAPQRRRNALSYPLAPFFGLAMGGGASGSLVAVAMIGVMAAIAIPSFNKYMQRAKAARPPVEAPSTTTADDSEPGSEPPTERGLGAARTWTGDRFAWRMEAPSAAWRARPDQEARRQNALVDRWFHRADQDAHVMVIGERTGGPAMEMDALVAAVIQNARAASGQLEVIDQAPLGRGGRLVRAEAVHGGVKLRYLFGLFTQRDAAYQVVGFAPARVMPMVEREMVAALASFEPGRELPPGPALAKE